MTDVPRVGDLELTQVSHFAGKQALAHITTFDFVPLLIIGEATQQSLLGNDSSVTNALLVITTLIAPDIGMALIKQRSKRFEQLIDGVPVIIAEDGQPLKDRMDHARVDVLDSLTAARELQGLEGEEIHLWRYLRCEASALRS